MEPSSSTSTSVFDQHINMCESTDEESSWFEKSIVTVQEGVHVTDSPHDKLNVEFTQDELNTELTSVNENSSLNSVLMPAKLTEVMHHEESVELIAELSEKRPDMKHQELIEDLTKDDEEEKAENVDMKDDGSSQLEAKLKEKPQSRDISDELSEMFFDVNDLNEETSKKDKLDEVLEEKLSELNSTEPSVKEVNTEEPMAEQESINVELDSTQLETSQLSTSLIDSSRSCDENSEVSKELEPSDAQSETREEAQESLTPSEENMNSEGGDKSLKSGSDNYIVDTKISEADQSTLKHVPGFDMDISDEVSENIKMNKESIELNEERMMVEFTHDDNEGRVLIQINENVKQNKHEQQGASTEERTEPLQENAVATIEEASTSHINERYILQEDEIAHVEGGAEFLEAVTGDIDKLLLETSKPQQVEPVKSTTGEAKPKPALAPKKCFVSTCKSGKTGLKNSNCRYFTPPANLQQFKKWETILVQGDQELKPDSTICEYHFSSKYFYRKALGKDGKFIWGLKEGAIPRLNNTGVVKFEPQKPMGALPPTTPRPAGVSSGSCVAAKSTTSQLKPKDIESMKKVLPKPEHELSSPEHINQDESELAPSYLIHNPDLIKLAQEEISSLDVLVCGECHSVFHFIEEFQEHKFIGNCRGQSNFKANLSEPKPQVWAFLLWKSAQSRVLSDIESSWKLYQRWCKMDENVRDTWIAAGKSIQDGTLLASIKIGESKAGRSSRPLSAKDSTPEELMRVKLMSRKVNIARSKQVQKIVRTRKSSFDSDDIEEEKMDIGAGDAGEDVEQEEHIDSDDMTVSSDGRASSLAQTKEETKLKPKDLSHLQEPTAKPKEDMEIKQEKAETQKEEEEEFVVEKIVSRRYNSKLKRYEYLLKWEGYPSEQNTWEPMENLETCKHLLKDFEASLVKEQAMKNAANSQKQAALQNQLHKKKTSDIISQPGPSGIVNSLGRPVRSSKQKALDQVKVWCGSMAKVDDDDGKRKLSSDSEYEEDLPSKKIKVEHDSEDSNDMDHRRGITRKYMRGGMRRTGNDRLVNGVKKEGNLAAALGLESESDEESESAKKKTLSDSETTEVVDGLGKHTVIRKMSSLSPQNQQVLVANAKGVVKVDHSQVPNLTSGVYIMSNKSGIIKLDNMSNKAISTLQKQQQQQQQKGGVVVLSKDTNKDGGTGTPQKSGIIRRVPTPSPSPSSASHPVPILPKVPGSTPARPAGILRPSGPTSTPRLPGLSPGVSPKIPGSVRPRGALMSSGSRMRTPVGNLLKPGVKPIESMLGGALQATPQQKTLLAKKKGIEDDKLSATSIGRKFLGHHLLGRGTRGGRGLGGRGRTISTGRGGSSLSTLLKGTDLSKELPIKDSKLVENDSLLMEFQEQSESEESDDGIVDPFPSFADLPPIEPDSPPRPLTLCPITGKVLGKAEGEKTPEPTPPPSPTPKFDRVMQKMNEDEHPGSILPDNPPDEDNESSKDSLSLKTEHVCKVEMSPGGTTGTVVEGGALVSAIAHTVEGGLTVKKGVASRPSIRGPQLSVLSGSTSTSTPIGTITVPARKLFQQEGPSGGEEEDMVTITGEDGLVYQVQVSNADMGGNTLLVSSGEDGQQQCVYVTTEGGEGGEGDESTILTLDTAYADAVAQLGSDQFYIKESDGGELVTLDSEEGTVMADDQGGQVVAQLVEAGEPAPGGGPRRVVLLLPDGNLMMTEVDEEQYAALDLDK